MRARLSHRFLRSLSISLSLLSRTFRLLSDLEIPGPVLPVVLRYCSSAAAVVCKCVRCNHPFFGSY